MRPSLFGCTINSCLYLYLVLGIWQLRRSSWFCFQKIKLQGLFLLVHDVSLFILIILSYYYYYYLFLKIKHCQNNNIRISIWNMYTNLLITLFYYKLHIPNFIVSYKDFLVFYESLNIFSNCVFKINCFSFLPLSWKTVCLLIVRDSLS